MAAIEISEYKVKDQGAILTQGSVLPPTLVKSEYENRIQKTKERMARAGIDVLLLTDPANIHYLSGYDGWSFYVHQMLVLIIDEQEPIWIGREQDANGARLTTWLSAEHIVPYEDAYVQSPHKHPMAFVASFLKEIGQGKRVIGVEKDTYYFTALCYEILVRECPEAVFKDGTLLVNQVRLIKSDLEIDMIKKAARISENAMLAGIKAISEGVRECDVAADVFHAQIRGTAEYGGDYPAIVPLMPSGERTSTPHLTWSDRTLQQGDTVLLELAGCYRRYHAPLARTVVVGEPRQKIRDLAVIVIEGLSAALDAVEPGVTCEYIEQVWRNTVQKHGINKKCRLGYAMGLNYPPDWGEHTASLRPGDQTILQPNMTFHMIPGVWLADHGVALSESFRVTEYGCEVLAQFPRELFIK